MGSRRIRAAAVTLALAVSAAAGVSAPASATQETGESARQRLLHGQQVVQAAQSDRLTAGQSLSGDNYLLSSNGQHELWADDDLYIMSGSGGVEFLTGELPQGAQKLIMQADGNLVLYLDGKPRFATATHGNDGAYAVMQGDGNLVVYSKTHKALWASRTVADYGFAFKDGNEGFNGRLNAGWSLRSANGKYRLVMQGDGNLVLYSGTRALWHTATHGNTGAYFVIQADGNLVVYSATHKPLWNSRTVRAVDAVVLVVQSDANLVSYGFDNDRVRVLWQSRTAGRG